MVTYETLIILAIASIVIILISIAIIKVNTSLKSQIEASRYLETIFILDARVRQYESIDNSEKIKDFILDIVKDVALMKFHEFKDTHDISKVSRSNVKDLAADVIKSSKELINTKKLEEYDNVLSQGFCDKYIVSTSIIVLKTILEKEVISIVEEEV